MAQWNRRQFLSGLLTAVGAEAATAVDAHPFSSLLSAPNARRRSDQPSTSTPPAPGRAASAAVPEGERALTEILPEGVHFGRWRLVAVHPVKFGAVPVVLETRTGERFQVDVLARDRRMGAKRGVAQTRHYSLHLANVGRGAKPTLEEHGLGVIWLAALLRAREGTRQPARLLTLRDRLVRFPTGRFDALRVLARPTQSPAPWGPVRSEPVPNNDHASALGLTASPFAAAPGLPKPSDGASNA